MLNFIFLFLFASFSVFSTNKNLIPLETCLFSEALNTFSNRDILKKDITEIEKNRENEKNFGYGYKYCLVVDGDYSKEAVIIYVYPENFQNNLSIFKLNHFDFKSFTKDVLEIYKEKNSKDVKKAFALDFFEQIRKILSSKDIANVNKEVFGCYKILLNDFEDICASVNASKKAVNDANKKLIFPGFGFKQEEDQGPPTKKRRKTDK